MKKVLNIGFAACLFLLTVSCEKVIDLDLPDGDKLVYVDAWITDQQGAQSIKLLEAVNYQDNAQPTPVKDATIKLTDVDINKTYAFVYKDGEYLHIPPAGTSIGVTGHKYRLEIVYNGEKFEAYDVLPRVTKIDSITVELREEENDEEEGYYAEFFARDLTGASDYYWIRTYRNGKLNSYLTDMLSIDGSFYEDVFDGFVFIPPFREGITSGEKPYQKGEEVKVLLRGISKDSYVFMEQALKQITNGGLFSEVLQNVPANLVNLQPSGKAKIYGWFGTVGESSLSKTVQ
jgi:hypothetical protein